MSTYLRCICCYEHVVWCGRNVVIDVNGDDDNDAMCWRSISCAQRAQYLHKFKIIEIFANENVTHCVFAIVQCNLLTTGAGACTHAATPCTQHGFTEHLTRIVEFQISQISFHSKPKAIIIAHYRDFIIIADILLHSARVFVCHITGKIAHAFVGRHRRQIDFPSQFVYTYT